MTFNFIDCWLKNFHHNYQFIWKVYNESLKGLFKKIPTMKPKTLIQDKNTSYY